MLPGWGTFASHLECHEFARHALVALPEQNIAAGKVAFVERHKPAQPGFNWCGLAGNVVAVQWQASFET